MLITAESVTEGHPDKLADQISDAILDALLEQDPRSRVAVETLLTNGVCLVAGEVTTSAYVDIAGIARSVIRDVGYTGAGIGFDAATSGVLIAIKEQSSDIARGVEAFTATTDGTIVNEDLGRLGAGDQGVMVGYACTETPELMPLPVVLAQRLCQRLAEVRRSGAIGQLRPDGKAQITLDEWTGHPPRVHTVLIAAQHDPGVSPVRLRRQITEQVIQPVLARYNLAIDARTKVYVNTTGQFVIGGPEGDTGLTGRKVVIDSYGPSIRVGGGAFSGKDPTKVDRSGAYAARWVAKHVVAAELATRCEVELAYAIGRPAPLAVSVNTFGTGTVSDDTIQKNIDRTFDLRPGMIIQTLGLRRPIYRQVAVYGHFGRPELNLPWEQLPKLAELRVA